MAHIIRNTPVLNGKNAENFVENILTKKTPSVAKQKQMEKDVAYLSNAPQANCFQRPFRLSAEL